MSNDQVNRYLSKISQVFDIDEILREEIDEEEVIEYYRDSSAGYQFFHSGEGAVHMALNYDGRFDKDGYREHARLVSKHIHELDAKRVLELASGKGFNSIFLAHQNPEVQFTGIDLTPLHVELARKKGKGIENLAFQVGNFQQLDFRDRSFDVVFEIESICHASTMRQALSEAFRVLRPGGRFIVFDGFRKPGYEDSDSDVRTAARITEIAMAVEHGWIIDDWLRLSEEIGFTVSEVTDLSEAIMPNLMRFQLLARGYFKYPRLARGLLRVLPPNLVKNAIAGLLMPLMLDAGAQGYYLVVLER